MMIRVGNLQRGTTEDDLRSAFEPFGEVGQSIIGFDRITKISRDFGFIEMSNQVEAHAAIVGMSSKSINGKVVTVGEAMRKVSAGPSVGVTTGNSSKFSKTSPSAPGEAK